MESVTVQLLSPIKDFGKELSALTISREVNGSDLVEIDGLGKNTATLKLISRLYGISWEAALRLSIRDIQRLEEAMSPFGGVGPTTGEPSSAG